MADIIFKKGEKVIITTHKSPDGDAIGSALAMFHHLKRMEVEVKLIVPDPAPDFLSWLPGLNKVLYASKMTERELNEHFANVDTIVCLDFNARNRCGAVSPFLDNNAVRRIVFDHHREPEGFHDEGVVDWSFGSTAEILFEYIDKHGAFNKDIAACLYTGILTDTGSFRFSSTTAATHYKAARLIEEGIEPSTIYSLVHDNYSSSRIRLLGYALYEKLKLYPNYRTAIIALSEEELMKYNYKKGDTEGLVNYPLSVKDIVFSVFISVKEGETRISLRSKGNFDVNKVARKHLHGGGHVNAAGGRSDVGADETAEKIVNLLKEYEDELKGVVRD